MKTTRTILTCSITVLVTLTIGASKSGAFPTYSVNRDATNCRACHGDFRAVSYISLSDGQNWGNLHNLHRTTMLSGDCDTCHGGSTFPVVLDSSAGGIGFPAIACMGCHGREEDIGNDSVSTGRGAGLRQHHFTAGVTSCAGCHTDANPTNYMPVGEDVPPAYYFTPDASHPDKPTNPCNPNGEEDYAGIAQGLDDDGDNLYDTADGDCVGVPAATVTSAISRRSNPHAQINCDTNLLPPRKSEMHQGGIQEVRIGFDVAPGGDGAGAGLFSATCAGGGLFAADASPFTGAVSGNELVLTFSPALANARTYRIDLGPAITTIGGQSVFVRGLIADADGNGFVNAVDRAVVVGAWTSPSGFTCATDLDSSGGTNAVDRALVVGAWTAPSNCAP